MKYSWAMEMQLQLLHRWDSGVGRKFVQEFYNHIRPMNPEVIDGIIYTGIDHCRLGETFAWSTEMCDLLMDVTPDLPDWSLTADLLPAPYGFMVFEKPLKLDILEGKGEDETKRRGYSLDARAIGWNCHSMAPEADGTTDEGTSVSPNDPSWPEKATHVSFIVYSHANAGEHADIPDTSGLPAPFVVWNWKLGETVTETQNRIDKQQALHDATETLEIRHGEALDLMRRRRIQYFGAAFLLMNQKILVDRKEIVKQSLERKMRNAGWKHEPNVRVVVLRHTTVNNPEGPPREIERTHRWWTRSHWRQQAYGPKKSLRKPILIFAHLNGPGGLPVKPAKKNLFAVVQ